MKPERVTNRSAPAATVVPILIYENVSRAIDWLCQAFGFTERLRADHGGVTSHAQLAVGDGAIMLGRQGGPYRAPQGTEVTAYMLVAVDNCGRAFRAREAVQRPHRARAVGHAVRRASYTARDHAGHW